MSQKRRSTLIILDRVATVEQLFAFIDSEQNCMIEFDWDENKAEYNLRKHRVGFPEAATVFRDPLSITVYDPDHSEGEDRYITIGASAGGRFLMVAHADRGNKVRIISARELTRAERRAYENEIQRRKG